MVLPRTGPPCSDPSRSRGRVSMCKSRERARATENAGVCSAIISASASRRCDSVARAAPTQRDFTRVLHFSERLDGADTGERERGSA